MLRSAIDDGETIGKLRLASGRFARGTVMIGECAQDPVFCASRYIHQGMRNTTDYAWLPGVRERRLFDPFRRERRLSLNDFQLSGLAFGFGEYESIRPDLQEECRLRIGKQLSPGTRGGAEE